MNKISYKTIGDLRHVLLGVVEKLRKWKLEKEAKYIFGVVQMLNDIIEGKEIGE